MGGLDISKADENVITAWAEIRFLRPGRRIMNIKKEEQILRLQTYGMYYEACYRWARYFENMQIAWIYWPNDDRGDHFCVEADFYLPDQDAYFIVDLGRPDRGYTDCKALSKRLGKMIVSGGAHGEFGIFEDGEHYSSSDAWLCQCAACGRYFFLNEKGDYICKVCGEYEGDHHLEVVVDGEDGAFDYLKD